MALLQANARRDVPGFNLLACLTRSVIQVIPFDVGALMEWDTVVFDPRGMWNASNPTVLTIKATGWYNISSNIGAFCDTKTDRNGEIRINGTEVASIARLGALTGGAFGGDRVLLSWETGPIHCNNGDLITVYVTQHSASDQDFGGPSLGSLVFVEAF